MMIDEQETAPPSPAHEGDPVAPREAPPSADEASADERRADEGPAGEAGADDGAREEEGAPTGGAVDTGRRIDPSRLVFQDPKSSGAVRLRKPGDRPPRRGKGKKGPRGEGGPRELEGAPEGDAAAGTGEGGPEERGEAGGEGARDDDASAAGAQAQRPAPAMRVVERDELYRAREGRAKDGKAREGRGPRGGKNRRGPPGGGRPGAGPFALPPVSKGRVLDDTGGKSFAELLAESGDPDRMLLTVGDRVQGEVVHVGTDAVFLSLGPGTEATLPLAEVLDEEGQPTVKAGDKVKAYVVGAGDILELSTKLGRHGFDPALLIEAQQGGIPVDGQVTGHNKGGLEVSLLGARGFCPLGQAALTYVEDPASFVGKTFSFLVTEVKGNGKEVVLSRRLLLEREKAESRERTMAELAVGQRRRGTVTRIQPFGAFVDLGGVDGLVPVSEMSFARLKDPSEVVSVGDEVEVDVLRIEDDPKRPGEKRIGLSLKHAARDPFVAYADQLTPGEYVNGRVTRLKAFGAFVELFEEGSGLEGLIHISEIADRRIGTPGEVLKTGQEVSVRVLEVDPAQRRVALSLKDGAGGGGSEPEARGPKKPGWRRGLAVTGVVDRIERYGVFVNVEGLGSALLPGSESGVDRGTDLAKALPLGTSLELLVIDVDDRGRAKVSRLAREKKEERELVKNYQGKKGGGGGFGTLGDLLKQKLGQ